MSDYISRQAAIDAIRASTSKYTGFMEMEMYTDDDAVEAIEGVPSAQPEQHWIPCSDRLPNSRETVIVSIRDETGDTRYDYTAHGWLTTDKEYWIVDDEINNYVIAWMPLPEPYKGEES